MIDRLIASNPWWPGGPGPEADPHLRAWRSNPIRWVPSLVNELPLHRPAIYTVRGPRQVGKTTALKLLVARSLRESPDEGVVYYACDLDRDPDAIRLVVQTAREAYPRYRRWRIFLDEITTVPDWPRAIKWLWDNTAARDDTFVLTGSSAADLWAGAERMPGRRRETRPDRILLPLSFRDFARLHGVPPPLAAGPEDFLQPGVLHELSAAALRLGGLQRLMERYLRTGGFPMAVVDEYSTGSVTEPTVRALWDAISGELLRQGRDPLRAYRLLQHTARAMGSPVDWTGLGEVMDADRRTAEEYVRLLASLFALLVLYREDPRRGGPMLRAHKKLYPADPLLGHLPARIAGGPAPSEAGLVEALITATLFRSVEQEGAEAFFLPRSLFYWRSQAGGEVDAVVGRGRERLGVEVKYRDRVDERELAGLKRSFRRGLVITRGALSVEDVPYPKVPAALFAWLCGREGIQLRQDA